MDSTDPRRLAAQVAAWHNRNPLAQRILPAQVQGIGVVAMPFVADHPTPARREAVPGDAAQPVASLRQRALARAQGGSTADDVASAPRPQAPLAPRRAFDEDFVAPISPRRAAAFAARHGSDADPAAGAWPLRHVLVDPCLTTGAVTYERHVRTAAIECADRRIRVLVAATDGDAPAILGHRVLSRTRVAAVLAPLWLVPALVFGVQHGEKSAQPQPAPMAVAAAVAAEASAVEPPVGAPSPVPNNEPAADVQIPARLDAETARRARRESAALRSAALLPAGHAPHPAGGTNAADAGKTFAVVARQTRSRAASTVLLGLMQTTAARQGQAGTHTDVLASSQGYRASWWPFTKRSDAERAREQLAGVGLPVDIVEF